MKYITLLILLISNISIAVQTCKLEQEIPSTAPDNRFIDNNNGTITDINTGLIWQKCQLGLSGTQCETGSFATLSWKDALDEAQNSSLAGFNDWRVPNHKELLSIIEFRCRVPATNINFFPRTFASGFWTSTPYAFNIGNALFVNFGNGDSDGSFRTTLRYVRLVRSK